MTRLILFSLLALIPSLSQATTMNLFGFETGDMVEGQSTSGTLSVQSTTKRTGGYALEVNPTTTGIGYYQFRKQISGLGTTFAAADIYFRFYFRYATKASSNDEQIFETDAGGSVLKAAVRLNSAGNLVFYDTTSTTVAIATGTAVLSSGTWYRIEIYVGNGTTASWEVKVDGTSDMSGTANVGTGNHALAQLGKTINRNGNTVDYFYDDVVVSDSGYPGAGAIEFMAPDGDGTYTAWTIGAGGGSDYTNVDEIPTDSDTTYLVSSSSGDVESVTLESAASAGISGTVNAVKTVNISKRNTAGSNYFALMRSNSTDLEASDGTTTATYDLRNAVLSETDPSDAGAWTTSDLDALEIGVHAASSNATRTTVLGAMVDFTAAAGGGGGNPATKRQIIIVQ